MLRKVLIVMLLFLPAATWAAGESALPPDSLKTKVVRTAKKVDRFLLKNQQKQNTDTDYIFKPQQKWLFRTRSDIVLNLLTFHNDHPALGIDYGVDLKAKPLFRQNIGVGYRGVILGFGIAIPFKNKDKEFSLKVYTNRAGGEVTYGQIWSLSGKLSFNESSFEVNPGAMPTQYVRVNAYYAFNWKKFSMPAAMSQSFIQRKSAGSPLATFGFRADWGTFKPAKFSNREFFVGLGGGYGYNWAPSEHWLIHISGTETFGLFGCSRITAFNNTTKFRMRFLPLLTAANAAVIYYYKRFYVGVFGTADVLFIPTREKQTGEDLYYTMSHVTGHLTLGFRL
ncbi:MAG: DUF4421 family protein [Bacteroidales bacterium]|nr:DUF4421 family protein [Bacteroidales bacterium]